MAGMTPDPERTMILNTTGRERLGILLQVAKDAVEYLPQKCHSTLYSTTRDLRYELHQAIASLEDHLDREGEAF